MEHQWQWILSFENSAQGQTLLVYGRSHLWNTLTTVAAGHCDLGAERELGSFSLDTQRGSGCIPQWTVNLQYLKGSAYESGLLSHWRFYNYSMCMEVWWQAGICLKYSGQKVRQGVWRTHGREFQGPKDKEAGVTVYIAPSFYMCLKFFLSSQE